MTRFVVDASALIHLAAEGIDVAPDHELLAPTLVRSQVLSQLHEAVHAGELSPDAAEQTLVGVNATKMRLLGDAVLRRLAWRLADELGVAATYGTEYLALTKLQGDALIALDPAVAALAAGVVPLASLADLTRPA